LVGRDREPIDLSKQENVDGFMEDMGSWGQKMAQDSEQVGYGYVDIEHVKTDAYGTASA